jgi:hypothetical protein
MSVDARETWEIRFNPPRKLSKIDVSKLPGVGKRVNDCIRRLIASERPRRRVWQEPDLLNLEVACIDIRDEYVEVVFAGDIMWWTAMIYFDRSWGIEVFYNID